MHVVSRMLDEPGVYRVRVRAMVDDADQIRLYRNRVRVLVHPMGADEFGATLTAQSRDLLEASVAADTPIAMDVERI